MPSRRAPRGEQSRQYQWCARVQLEGVTYQLGYHCTATEALGIENQFKRDLRHITADAHAMWQFQLAIAGVKNNNLATITGGNNSGIAPNVPGT